jgi:hypothetical protein
MRAVDHLDVVRATASGKLTEQPLPHTALGPTDESIVDGRWRAILRRAILPTTAAPQDMQDAADHLTIVCTLLAAHVSRQVRLDPLPLLIVQPE